MEKLIFPFFCIFTFTIMTPFTGGNRNYNMPAEQEVQDDGPYVLYNKEQVLVEYIMESNGIKQVRTEVFGLQKKDSVSLTVRTDIEGKTFNVNLKKKLRNERCEYRKVKRLFVLSDIEGNFSALRKLLQAGKVIDENYNWIFSDGHLVLVGDFFDRGQQVTEVLWFIYYLEEKAKAAGGYVHLILGNHEVMNLSGDLRYVSEKYIDNAKLIVPGYVSLYDEHSELGRWLRTKNVVEKIGDILFVHGGISARMNSMNIPITDINLLARPYYADDDITHTNEKSVTIFSDFGPMWYRGYYERSNKDIASQIDNTLSQYEVSQIITGHTIVADTISAWYNGKLLDLDVHHAEGKSEALLIEDGKYYRVNPEGKKVLMMEEIP